LEYQEVFLRGIFPTRRPMNLKVMKIMKIYFLKPMLVRDARTPSRKGPGRQLENVFFVKLNLNNYEEI
jgi:hypothetical protein